MSGHNSKPTVGALPDTAAESPVAPAVLTLLVWSLFVASIAVLLARIRSGAAWDVPGLVAVDGLTVLLWVVVTFFSGIVHSYSRRYMAGSTHKTRFFLAVFGFTAVVMALVAADHVVLFGVLWVAMGLLMAELIGISEGWTQAQAAAAVARRYFMTSSALLGLALTALWWATGTATVSGIGAAADTLGGPVWLLAAGALVLAGMIQSALVPFHGWLLSSMTAPTPASALMHAGFVNAGGVLLARFAPVITADSTLMLVIVAVGAASAVGGKLLKSVRTDIKGKLGCSTVGQMGFMIMQAGLGFFGAAITHLILHGFYKAYQFLSSGEQVEHTTPSETTTHTIGRATSAVGFVVAVSTGLGGGVVFAVLTGKGANVDSGLLLVFFVVFTTLHAARSAVRHTSLPALARHGAVPLVFFPAIVVYALVYDGVSNLLAVSAAPTELTLLHGVVAVGFAGIYVAIETGVHEHSQRLYVALLNAARPSPNTLLTSTEEYNEY
ncbi:Mrp-type sodium/proton antiporter system subunit D4 [Natronomonas moolapensis 8.8.11]|uniref:Mrp-type sodium/proton antiporter system subunit D4 n=1 Tax=Natronomonas moolapensis (strain DSM 18674 / CECT 7526 / JCM 14361 / 8.8.11) TaxID=268739 RepID=M1Y586_NATM8|nr:proton-conducting transporter membrane subunit [Natronomonas moolapensis]CCQ37717.1 Mrp-type sodium/proton antiporter system subunit D4 [Natronomonas moolapensis 8.8.11]